MADAGVKKKKNKGTNPSDLDPLGLAVDGDATAILGQEAGGLDEFGELYEDWYAPVATDAGVPPEAGPSIAQQIIDSGNMGMVQEAAASMDGGVSDTGAQTNAPVFNINIDGGASAPRTEATKPDLEQMAVDGPVLGNLRSDGSPAPEPPLTPWYKLLGFESDLMGGVKTDSMGSKTSYDAIQPQGTPYLTDEQKRLSQKQIAGSDKPITGPDLGDVISGAFETPMERMEHWGVSPVTEKPFDTSWADPEHTQKMADDPQYEYELSPEQYTEEESPSAPKPKKKRARRPTRESVGEPEVKKEAVAEAVVQSITFPDREPWFVTTANALMEANPMFAHVIPGAINKVALDFYGNALRKMSEEQKADDDSYLKLMNSILRHSQAKDLKAQEIQGYLARSRKRSAKSVGHDWGKGKASLSDVADYLMTLDRPMQSTIIDLYNANLDTDELYGAMLESTWSAAATLLSNKGAKGAHADPDELQAARLQLGFTEHEDLNDKQIEKAVQDIVRTSTDKAISLQRATGLGSDRAPTYIGQYEGAQNAMLQALVLAAQKDKVVRDFINESGSDTKKSMQNIVTNIMKMKKVHPSSRGRVRKAPKKKSWQK